jgi:hypothetical protein
MRYYQVVRVTGSTASYAPPQSLFLSALDMFHAAVAEGAPYVELVERDTDSGYVEEVLLTAVRGKDGTVTIGGEIQRRIDDAKRRAAARRK